MVAIDISSMRLKPRLNPQKTQGMCRKVLMREVQEAIFSIDINKTPGIDRYSTYFFKKAKKIIQADVYASVQ